MRQHPLVVDEDKRLVAGWASVEVKDLQGDIVPVAVLERAMYDLMSRGGVVMLEHSNVPVGRIVRWEVREHPETGRPGLWVEVELYRGTDYADSVWGLVREGKLRGFSISGFGREEKQKEVEVGGQRVVADLVTDLELTEISLVGEPANQYARIEYVNMLAKSLAAGCAEAAVGLGDPEDVCRWAESVYGQYGYSSPAEMVRDVASFLGRKREAKAEGPVTTGTEGYHNPVYGDRPTAPPPKADEGETRASGADAAAEVEPEVKPEWLDEVRRIIVELREVVDQILEVARGGRKEG